MLDPKPSGMFIVDDQYAAESGLDMMMIYLDGGKAWIGIVPHDGEDDFIQTEYSARFGKISFAEETPEFPGTQSYKYDAATGRLALYIDDAVYFVGWHDRRISSLLCSN